MGTHLCLAVGFSELYCGWGPEQRLYRFGAGCNAATTRDELQRTRKQRKFFSNNMIFCILSILKKNPSIARILPYVRQIKVQHQPVSHLAMLFLVKTTKNLIKQCLKRTCCAPVVVVVLRFLQTAGTESLGHFIKHWITSFTQIHPLCHLTQISQRCYF